jgi:glyoxylase-like metal-dependent hydrolase (beta-lactamase superfamily II)
MQVQTNGGHKIGSIELTPLWDGPLPSTLGKIPDPAHRAEAEKLIAHAGADALTMDVYGFLLKRGDRFALIDTGAGRLMSADLGKLVDSLRAAGVMPEQIEHIFMTHVHRDHYGGMTDAQGRAVFPNAQLVLHEKEAAFWLDSKIEDLPERAQKNFDSARQAVAPYLSKLRRVQDDEDLGGTSAHLAPGHTPGHTAWLIQSDGHSLLAWGDLVHVSALHLPAPHIAMEYDLDPATALRSRRRVLDWVSADHILVAGAHLPAPGIGAIVRRGNGYAYEPAK